MNYYQETDTQNIFGFTDEQVAEGFASLGFVALTSEQVDAVINPPETETDLIASAEQKKKSQISIAVEAMVPLEYAVELGMATDEEIVLLKAWKKYRVLLMRVDTAMPEWPALPV